MKKFILPIILLLTVVFFLSPKADAQTLRGQDCTYENYYKESNKCLKVSGDCLKACLDQAKGSYLDEVSPADKYSACVKSNDCHGKQSACGDQTWAEYLACKNAGRNEQNPAEESAKGGETAPGEKAKGEPGILDRLGINPYQLWLNFKDLFEFQEIISGPGLDLQSGFMNLLGRQSTRQKEAEIMEGSAYKAREEWARQRLQPAEFFPVDAKEEFLISHYLDTPLTEVTTEVISVPGREDIKVYPWGEGSGAAIKSADWEKIEFVKPEVDDNGVIRRTIKLEDGEVEVKVKNGKPAEIQFGVDAGWVGVTVSRTHFLVAKDQEKEKAAVVVYEGEVEVKTRDGKTVKVRPDGDKPGVVGVSQKLSPVKLTVLVVILAVVIGGVILIVRRKFASKRSNKRKK